MDGMQHGETVNQIPKRNANHSWGYRLRCAHKTCPQFWGRGPLHFVFARWSQWQRTYNTAYVIFTDCEPTPPCIHRSASSSPTNRSIYRTTSSSRTSERPAKEQRGILHPNARQSQSQIQPSISPCSYHIRSGVPLVSPPYPCSSHLLRCQLVVRGSLPAPQSRRRPTTPRPPPLPHQPSCAEQSPPSPVEEGLDLYLPYHKHIWRLASIKTVCAWRLPSKTALYLWTSGGEKKTKFGLATRFLNSSTNQGKKTLFATLPHHFSHAERHIKQRHT